MDVQVWSKGLQKRVSEALVEGQSKVQIDDVQLSSEIVFVVENGLGEMAEVVSALESYSDKVSQAVIKSCDRLESLADTVVMCCNQEPGKGTLKGGKSMVISKKEVPRKIGILKKGRAGKKVGKGKEVSFKLPRVYEGPVWDKQVVKPWEVQGVSPWEKVK